MKRLVSDKELFIVFFCLLATILFALPILNAFPNINSLISETYATLIQTAFFGFSIFISGYIASLLLIPKADPSERLWLSIGLSMGLIMMTILLVGFVQSIFPILPIPSQIKYSVIVIIIAIFLAVIPKKG